LRTVTGEHLAPVADVAADLDVSPRTVMRWIEQGKLPALRMPGGRLRISAATLAAWQAEHTTVSQTRIVTLHTPQEEEQDADR
jgi:excisionase family DNA binding protein